MTWVSAFRLRLCVRHLRRGGLVAYPTEAVYGLGCDPTNLAAIKHLLALKRRPAGKGLILIAADFRQLEPYLDLRRPGLREQVQAGWPGPITRIVPAQPWVPSLLRGEHEGLAVRVTAHAPSVALCRRFGGPLVSTSANPGGVAPARTRVRVRRYFLRADLVFLPGSLGGQKTPTSIYDALSGERRR